MKTLVVTRICNCGKQEKLFFNMTQKTDGRGGYYYQSQPQKDITMVIETQIITVDACSYCVGNRDLFGERKIKEAVAEETEEFLKIGEMYE